MRIALQLTDRLKYRWPADYCREFAVKASKAGHTVVMVADEPNIVVELKIDGVQDRTNDNYKDVLEGCDVFIGPPLAMYDTAKRLGLRTIALQGASFEGDGVRSTTFCGGCDSEGKLEPRPDCLWQDEICMWEISPKMVMEVL